MKNILVRVEQLFLSNIGFVVLLKGHDDPRSLPIFIGAPEAQSIAIQLNQVQISRPLTHDLIKNILDYLECRLRRIEISELKEGTFFAKLILERDGNEMEMDSRPSDAIALALRCGAPIFVAEKVMNEAGQIMQHPDGEHKERAFEDNKTEHPHHRHKMTPIEHLKHALEKAVKEEKYEEAARLRDEIKRLEHPHSGN